MRTAGYLIGLLIFSAILAAGIWFLADSQGWTITDAELREKLVAIRQAEQDLLQPSPVVVVIAEQTPLTATPTLQHQPTPIAVPVPDFFFTPTPVPS